MTTPKRIPFTPRFDKPVHGHAVNTARKFYPALASDYDMDDLLQEAYIVFMKCKAKYGPRRIARPGTVIDNPAWFMAVFSRSLHNKFINMAQRSGRYVGLDAVNEEAMGVTEDINFMLQTLRELPDDIKALVQQVIDGTADELAALQKVQFLFTQRYIKLRPIAGIPRIRLRPIKTS